MLETRSLEMKMRCSVISYIFKFLFESKYKLFSQVFILEEREKHPVTIQRKSQYFSCIYNCNILTMIFIKTYSIQSILYSEIIFTRNMIYIKIIDIFYMIINSNVKKKRFSILMAIIFV